MMALAALEEGEAHGYELMQRLEARSAGVLRMKEGTLYPVLYRLEEKGAIKAHWEDGAEPRRGPRRRIYRLTAKGRRELTRQRAHWREFVAVMGRIVEGTL